MAKRNTRHSARPRRNAQARLKRFWRAYNVSSPPYLHPQDKEHIERFVTLNYEQYQAQFGDVDDSAIHAGMLPKPFEGNLSRADVFILMLNPGFHPIGYYAEERDREFRESILCELHQKFRGQEYPFTLLNPRFCYYAGFTYWHQRLRKIVQAVADGRGISYRNALRFISKRLAVIQLLPYHSRTFDHGRLLDRLPSVASVKDFVTEIRGRAKRNEITVVVTRRADDWGFSKGDERKNVVVYQGSELRGGQLNKRALQAIASRFGVKLPKG